MASILVVEDEKDLLQVMSLSLSREGHAVYTAETGPEALLKVDTYDPELIILDIMLPEMSGWDICLQIRERSEVPIIMVTALARDQDVVRGLQIGADEYITKPFQLQTLIARVNALLRRMKWDRQTAEKEVESLKKSITSTVSHELRTPLAAIMGTLDLALQEAFRDNSEAQRDFIHDARINVVTMRQLVDDLLVLSRIDQGLEIIRRPVSIQSELKRLVEIYQSAVAEKNLEIHITCPEGLSAHLDQFLTRQAFAYLFSNAVKFSPERGQIWIVAEPLPHAGVEVDFHDQGPGIAPQYHDKIFKRFYQMDMGTRRRSGGLGIGLYIAREIALAHGGNISLISHPGRGSIFSLTLPGSPSDLQLFPSPHSAG